MRRNATRRSGRTFARSIPDSARGFLFRRFPSFPLSSEVCLCRKAFPFPHRNIGGIVQDVGGVCFDFILCHAAHRAIVYKYGQTIKIPVLRRRCGTEPISSNARAIIVRCPASDSANCKTSSLQLLRGSKRRKNRKKN